MQQAIKIIIKNIMLLLDSLENNMFMFNFNASVMENFPVTSILTNALPIVFCKYFFPIKIKVKIHLYKKEKPYPNNQ